MKKNDQISSKIPILNAIDHFPLKTEIEASFRLKRKWPKPNTGSKSSNPTLMSSHESPATSRKSKRRNFKQKGKNRNNHHKREIKIDENDDRFADFNRPEKKPPVDMYGRPISPDALEKYVSSSDDEIEMLIPSDAVESSNDEEQAVYSDEIYRRIAIVDLPWKNITAQDLYQYMYLSLENLHDDITSVTVYLSHYGEEHPETEAPPPTDNEDIETARWRKREKQNMKRYFAICEFKDKKVADKVYCMLQNTDISDTGSKFNVSFVNDEIQFQDMKIRDQANAKVDDWEPPEILAPFLNRTKNKDDWDSPSNERKAAFRNIWESVENGDEDDDYAASLIMGSGSEDEEKPSRDALMETLNALHGEEEEEVPESESEKEFEVNFVQGAEEQQQKEEIKTKKTKKKKENVEVANEDATINEIMEDDRFKELFAKPGYGINTADPNFKRTPMMEKFMDEVSKKHLESTSEQKTEDQSSSTKIESTVERLRRRSAMNANQKT